jgi:hypothetical protein
MCVAANQRNSCQNEPASLATALALLDPAALPEYFDYFEADEGALAAAEPVPGPAAPAIAVARARPLGAGRSHYALAPVKPCSNASLRFDREGRIADRHDKPHFVDIGLANQPNYREFEAAGGNRVAAADFGGAVASPSI